jgi:hypothetical protein
MWDHKSKDYTGEFYGAPVDYRDEYVQARKLMGLKGTDLDALLHTVGLLYVHCPDHVSSMYAALIEEITARQSMIAIQNLFTPARKTL